MQSKYHPLIHAITNPVTINDVVNMILAAGATAICADNAAETAEITAISQGLLLNTGMPNDAKLEAMLAAGREANRRGIPVILDPVGAGASNYRKQFFRTLLAEVHMTCIRGNHSEMAALAGIAFRSHGVEDAGITPPPEKLQKLAEHLDTVLAVSGDTDLAVSANQILESKTGSPLLKKITGAGCMLSGYLAARIAAGRLEGIERSGSEITPADRQAAQQGWQNDSAGKIILTESDVVQIVHEGLTSYGLAAETAEREMRDSGHVGNATFRTYLIDAVSRESGEVI